MVKWRPIKDAGREINFNSCNDALTMFRSAFERYGDDVVFFLDRKDLPVLRGIESTGVESDAVRAIMKAIVDNGKIAVEWVD